MKRIAKIIIALALVAAVFTGCQKTNTTTTNETTANQTTAAATNSETSKATEPEKEMELTLFFPVAVGGPLTQLIDQIGNDFTAENPKIKINPVYCGSYADTMVKAQTAINGNKPPEMAVLFSIDLFTLIDMDAIIPLDDYIASAGGDTFLNDFYPGLMENAQTPGKTWSIPFQRSTIVMYYNKDAFKAAGLDAEKPPKNWDELATYAKALTVKEGDVVKQWGLQIPSTGYPYWMFQALAMQNGMELMNSEGTEVYFDKPETIEALTFWKELGTTQKVMPEGIVEWGTLASNFLEGNTAIMYHSTGNLTKVKNEAKFDFGVAFLPAKKNYGSPTGGGNLYIFKDIDKEKQDAAWKFIEFATSPERAAQWCIDTGYVGTRKSAWTTENLTNYAKDFTAAAVARDQLDYAKAELSVHSNSEVVKILNDNIQAALVGTKTPEQAMNNAQEAADKVLAPFKK